MKTNLAWLPVTAQRAHPEIVRDGCYIARLDGVNLQGFNHAQSAAHIVHCVNSHDRLVAACREALECLESSGHLTRDFATAVLRAALADEKDSR